MAKTKWVWGYNPAYRVYNGCNWAHLVVDDCFFLGEGNNGIVYI